MTARAREETLQDVPISVSPIFGKLIDETDIDNVEELATSAPNFTVTQGSTGDAINIRGIFTGEIAGLEQSASTFVHGVIRGRGTQSRFALLDPRKLIEKPTDTTSTRSTRAPASSTAGVRGWEGVTVDGDIHLDRAGQVIADLALRQLFDFFMTARGVLSEQQIRERLLQEAHNRGLAQTGFYELNELFTRYRSYLAAVGSITPQGQGLQALRAATEARRQMRRAMLGPAMADGFFATDEAEEGSVLARMEILNNKNLTARQRSARIDALMAELPESVRESERTTRMLQQLDEATEAMAKSGAGDAQLFAARAEIVGTQAAERLVKVDEAEAAWRVRMNALRQQLDAIRATPGSSPADQACELDGFIERQFVGAEAVRARAYLRILDEEAAVAATTRKDKNTTK